MIHGLAVWKQFRKVGLNQDQVRSSRRPPVVFASNAAPQLCEIVLRPQRVTVFGFRLLFHTFTSYPLASTTPRPLGTRVRSRPPPTAASTPAAACRHASPPAEFQTPPGPAEI